jgi:PleD family two-component response regulator
LSSPAPHRNQPPFLRTPVAVVIDEHEWTARALEGILGEAGFAVVKAYDRREAADLLSRVLPDALFIDLRLEDGDGMSLYRDWLDDSLIDVGVPVIALASGRPDREERLAALAAGAWDVLALPLDADELVLRLGTVVRAKQAADQIREESLVDAATGLYNARGVLQKLSELRSSASRKRAALACIVLGRRPGSAPEERSPAHAHPNASDVIGLRVRTGDSDAVSRIWRATRRSDAKGALSGARFVVVAPDTDLEGAHRLAERIIGGEGKADHAADLVAGLFVASDLEGSPVTASDFLARASEALRETQLQPGQPRILGYSPNAN